MRLRRLLSRPSDPHIRDAYVPAGLVSFAAVHLALGLLMAVSPHDFFRWIGPFGVLNSHYIRDTATFYLAFAAIGALAVTRASWHVPVLAMMTVEYALHSLNHLLDIGRAHPHWLGWFDFLSIFSATILLVRLLTLAHDAERAGVSTRAAPAQPVKEVSP